MDSMEANKIVAAILAGGIAFMAAGFIADGVIRPTELKAPAFMVKTVETAAATAPKPAPLPPIEPLLASANIKTGEQYVSTTCAACHNYTKGGGAKVGPDLYDVVGRERFSVKGFDYSDAVKKLHGTWTYPDLDAWLEDPQKVAPGTRMAFPGIKQTPLRADVIAYLRTLSPTPVALPTAEQVAKVEAAYKTALAASKAPAAPTATTAAKPTAASPFAPPGLPSVAPLLASANVKQGEQIVEQDCAVCHNYKKGGGAKVGPDLYDVVGRDRYSVKGFDYSDAVKKLRGGPWTYADLDAWLDDPMKVAPGTRMAFPGLKNIHQRADVIAFLRTLSPKPVPLPASAPTAAPAAAAPAPASPSAAPAPAAPAKPAAAPSVFSPPGLAPVTPLLATANVKQGEQIVEQVCAVCHNYNKSGGAKVGPDLYGVVGRERFSVKGFDYSDAVKKLRGAPWTYAELDAWLDDPGKVAPGTRMSFPGLKNVHQRADVIAFLRSLAAKPEPLPAGH